MPPAADRPTTSGSGCSTTTATPSPPRSPSCSPRPREHPEAAILGPKLREWPSLRRLLEVGLTITGTGHRETGLERGEYDQGQHDAVREVLAVNTAGMLVRRGVLESLGGLDEELPIFGNDIDFGWRAALAGHRTLVVPQAVVFHAEAAHRGVRRTPLTGRHTHYQERRAALFTSLANVSGAQLRLAVRPALLRLAAPRARLPRRPLGGGGASTSSPPCCRCTVGRARCWPRGASARAAATASPPTYAACWRRAWLPYRHGLDFVTDLASAATSQAADVAERRRLAKTPDAAAAGRAAARSGASSAEDDEEAYLTDTGLVARFFTNPVAVVLVLFGVLALLAGREAFGSITGGALSPVPAAAGDWWRCTSPRGCPLGTGTDVPAPAYVLPFARRRLGPARPHRRRGVRA